MFDLRLTAEQLEMRDAVRAFVEREVRPPALMPARLQAMGRPPLLADALDAASRMGLRSFALPEALGGAGADALTACIVIETLATGDTDAAAILGETARLAPGLFGAMTPEQRERHLPGFLAGDRFHLAFAGCGTEADDGIGIHYHRPRPPHPGPRARATPTDRGDWLVNGTAAFVANAPLAKLFALEVRIGSGESEGVATLLVERDTPGLEVIAPDAEATWFHGARGDLAFRDCRVPAANLLSTPGARAGAAAFAPGPSPLPAANLGVGRAAYEAALDYAKLRVQGGRRIIEHPSIGTKLAAIATELEAARSLLWQAAWAADHPGARAEGSLPDLPLAAVARVFVAEVVERATLRSAEVFGAMGVMRDMPMQKYVRDAKIFLTLEGANGEAKLAIAEALAGYSPSRTRLIRE